MHHFVIVEKEARNGIKEYSVATQTQEPDTVERRGIWPFRRNVVIPGELVLRPIYMPATEEESWIQFQGEWVKHANFGNRQAAEEFIDEKIKDAAERSKFDVIKETVTRYPNV